MAYTKSNQIGEITEVTGVAKIIRTDGTEETVTLGTEVFQGDIVETSDAGAVNIGFIDDSSFAVSNDARISIDEFVFDPETEGGVQDFSVMKGVFMYTSGLIGRENPDQVEIDTPVGSIGIRGTIIGGDIQPDGESSVSVLEGAIVVRNDGGEQLLTNQYETVTLTSRDVAPSEAQQLDASRIANKFETVKDVSPSLFSSLNDQMAQEQDLGESNTSETTNEVKEEAVEEEIKAEEEVVEETVAEEQLLEEQQPEAETLEDSIEQIETLDTMPEMKTIEMSVDAKNSSALRPKAKLLKQLRESLGEDQNIEDVQFISQLEFDISLNGELREANNANAFSTGAPISIGSITLQEGGNALYEIFSDPTGFFTIDSVTGELFFNGTHMRDFENDGGFNLGIKATDQSTGRILAKDIRIGVADVDESPDVRIALEDVYSVGILALASDDQGIVARDVMGARIAKLAINDPEGETYTAADFSIVSASLGGQPANTFFQVVEDNGDFYLELKPGFMVTGANNIINDGTSDITTPLGTMFNITVSLDGTNQSIDLRSGEVKDVVGTGEELLANNDNIVIGDDADNTIRLSDDDFTFINGGDGYDTIILDSATTNFTHNLSGDAYKDEMSSIENINFADGDDTLKITLDNLIRLVKTSNNNVDGKAEIVISTDGTGSNLNGLSIVQNDGVTATDLTGNGFNHNGQQDRGGEVFDIYTHDVHGTIAVEATISNAGGL